MSVSEETRVLGVDATGPLLTTEKASTSVGVRPMAPWDTSCQRGEGWNQRDGSVGKTACLMTEFAPQDSHRGGKEPTPTGCSVTQEWTHTHTHNGIKKNEIEGYLMQSPYQVCTLVSMTKKEISLTWWDPHKDLGTFCFTATVGISGPLSLDDKATQNKWLMSRNLGWWHGRSGKGAYHQAWKPEFYLRVPHGGRIAPTPKGLSSDLHTCAVACVHVHTQINGCNF